MSKQPDNKKTPKFYWDVFGNLYSLNYERNSRYGFRGTVTQSADSRDAYVLLIMWDSQKEYSHLLHALEDTNIQFKHMKDPNHPLYKNYGECLTAYIKHASVRDARSQVESWILLSLEALKQKKG